MEKLCAFLREKLAACEEQDEAKSSSAYEQVLRGSIRRLKEENMLSQESQKMCFECSVAINCELMQKFKI